MRSILTTLGAASLAVILVAAFVVRTLEAPATETDDRMAAPAEVGGHMAAAADVFIETLSTDQRDQGTWELDAEQRFDWHFIPRARYGVLLKDMNPEQRTAAHGLLQSVLSSQGYLKATGVMQLEGILGQIEGRPDRRDPEDYYFNIFGTPSEDGAWAWRFEGHHISMNFAAAGGELPSVTPAFLGSNPAVVREGPNAGRRLLGAEEDLARELMGLFTNAQLRTVIIEAEAPRDIITGNARMVELDQLEGLPASEMNDTQTHALMHVIEEYLNNSNADVADAQMQRIHEAGLENLHFAWAGKHGARRGSLLPHPRTHRADRVRQRAGWSQPRAFGVAGPSERLRRRFAPPALRGSGAPLEQEPVSREFDSSFPTLLEEEA